MTAFSLPTRSSAPLVAASAHPTSTRIGLYQALASVAGLVLVAGLRLPHLLGLPYEATLRCLNAADAIAVFAVIAPAASALTSHILPALLGTRCLAFPRLNQLSFVFHGVGIVLVVLAYAVGATAEGGSRWLLLSSHSSQQSGEWVNWILAAVMALGASHALAALNVLATVGATRTSTHDWFRLPVLAWALYARALMHALAGPALVMFALVAMAERSLSLGLLDASTGGDPLLAMHLFWFGFHPLLMGGWIVSLAISLETLRGTTLGEPASGIQRWMVLAFAGTSMLAWGQHMVATSMGGESAMIFCAMGMLSLVPLMRLVADGVWALSGGEARWDAAFVFALATLVLLVAQIALGVASTSLSVSNGLDAVLFGRLGLDLLIGSTALGLTSAALRWWPALTGHEFHGPRALAAAGLICGGASMHFVTAMGRGALASSPSADSLAKASGFGAAALMLSGAVALAHVLVSSLRPRSQAQLTT